MYTVESSDWLSIRSLVTTMPAGLVVWDFHEISATASPFVGPLNVPDS